MIDAVLSHHMNPLTCGVAKWNHALAAHLGVPCFSISAGARLARHPLVSIKPSELFGWVGVSTPYDLFLHGYTGGPLVTQATRVYVGNRELAAQLRPIRPDVIEAFCPATVSGDPTRGAYRVLVFGMAHKLALPHFVQLKAQLDAHHHDYTIELSTAVHEGSPWETALEEAVDAMRAIFGDKLRVLGFLGDDALAKELQDCDAVAAYFTPALRANNTSAWAALAAGKTLYTNTDADSPALDVSAYSWPKLLDLIRGA